MWELDGVDHTLRPNHIGDVRHCGTAGRSQIQHLTCDIDYFSSKQRSLYRKIVTGNNAKYWSIARCCSSYISNLISNFFLLQRYVFLSIPRIFCIILQWSCSESGSLWEMPYSNPEPLPQKSGAQPMSHHITKPIKTFTNALSWKKMWQLEEQSY